MALRFSSAQASNANGVSGIDNAITTVGTWVQTVVLDGTRTIFSTGSALSGGQNAFIMVTKSPVSVGWRLGFQHRYSTTTGEWTVDDDLALGTYFNLVVVHDRSNVANNPTIYIDGASVAFTEDVTPVGSPKTGVDSVSLGKNVAGGQIWDGIEGEVAIWDGALDPDDIASFAAGVSPIRLRSVPLAAYWPLLSTGEELSGIGSGANLTLDSTTVMDHPPVAPQFGYDLDWPPAVVAAGTAALTGSVVPTVTEALIVTG